MAMHPLPLSGVFQSKANQVSINTVTGQYDVNTTK